MADSAVIETEFWILGERVADSDQWPKLLPAIAKKADRFGPESIGNGLHGVQLAR